MSGLWLMLMFLGNGCAQFIQKLVHVSGYGAYQALALLLMYAAGLLFAAALLLLLRGRIGWLEVITGCAIGGASFAGNWGVLGALSALPAHVVFPLIGAGPIVIVAIYSRLFRGERLAQRQLVGVALGIAAVGIISFG